MQIARNALALGDLGQAFNLFVRLAQFPVHAVALGKEDIAPSTDDRKNCRIKHHPSRHMQQIGLDRSNANDCGQTSDRGRLGLDHEGHKCACEDEKGGGAAIEGNHQHSQQGHASDVDNGLRLLQKEDSKIKGDEYKRGKNVESPQLRADVVNHWLDEKEPQIEHPEEGAPSVLFVAKHLLKRLET